LSRLGLGPAVCTGIWEQSQRCKRGWKRAIWWAHYQDGS